jgi:hypothetical protein
MPPYGIRTRDPSKQADADRAASEIGNNNIYNNNNNNNKANLE